MDQNLIETAPGATYLRLTRDAHTLLDVIKNWHDEHHADSWRMCMEEPCRTSKRFSLSVEVL